MSTRALRARNTRSLVEGLERLQRKSAADGKLQFLTYLISMAAHQATIEEGKKPPSNILWTKWRNPKGFRNVSLVAFWKSRAQEVPSPLRPDAGSVHQPSPGGRALPTGQTKGT